jgi:hypothetical protein
MAKDYCTVLSHWQWLPGVLIRDNHAVFFENVELTFCE